MKTAWLILRLIALIFIILLKLFKEADITIRDFAGTDHFRISIGNKQENEAVLNVMSQYVREML